MQKDFDALVTTLSFGDPATVKAINNWCSEHTNGKINEIIDQYADDIDKQDYESIARDQLKTEKYDAYIAQLRKEAEIKDVK